MSHTYLPTKPLQNSKSFELAERNEIKKVAKPTKWPKRNKLVKLELQKLRVFYEILRKKMAKTNDRNNERNIVHFVKPEKSELTRIFRPFFGQNMGKSGKIYETK